MVTASTDTFKFELRGAPPFHKLQLQSLKLLSEGSSDRLRITVADRHGSDYGFDVKLLGFVQPEWRPNGKEGTIMKLMVVPETRNVSSILTHLIGADWKQQLPKRPDRVNFTLRDYDPSKRSGYLEIR